MGGVMKCSLSFNLRVSSFVGAIIVFGVSALLIPSSHADDWPQYRGPNRDGISQEKGWQAQGLQQGPKIAWRASVGTGFSSVSISNGKAYTMGNSGDVDTISCFDATTGKEIWRQTYSCPCDAAQNEGGPNSTPTVDGDRVYTFSRRGQLFCLDANTGKGIWSKEAYRDFGASTPQWGFACSPLVLENLLIVDMGGKGASTVALNKSTGAAVWSTGNDPVGYSSPIPYKFGNYPYSVSFNGFGLVFHSAANGQEACKIPWKTNSNVNAAAPIFTPDNKVFISSGYNTGCALIQLSSKAPALVWQNMNMRNHFSSCVFLDGYIYGFDESELRCLDLQRGSVQWSQRGLGKGSLIAADGKLIVLSEMGELLIATAAPSGFSPISRAQILGGRCWTMPAFSGGCIYARNSKGDLVCVDLKGN